MAFSNFYGIKYENAHNFLDDLEMAFLVSGRDDEGVKLRAFPLVLRDEAKTWFQGLQPNERSSWENLKQAFVSRYDGGDNPKEMWKRLTALQQSTLGSYEAHEA